MVMQDLHNISPSVKHDASQQLQEIDNAMSQEAQKLTAFANSVVFETVMEFELGEAVVIPELISKKKGVYFFELKNTNLDLDSVSWMATFAERWRGSDVIWVPDVKKGRMQVHATLGEWIPLYIGKSKNVGGRVFEHIHQVKDKTTFSMKLNARSNMHGERLRVKWIPLDVVNYDMIAPAVERLLRDRFNPITGKQ
jgi:hypothetical protein